MKKIDKIAVITGGLLLSGGLIAGLASAAAHKHGDKDGYRGGYGHHAPMKAKRLDVNKDGNISQEELLARNVKRFEALDTDKDGLISADEFNARTIELFVKMDANNDGLISVDELPKRKHKGHHGKHKGEHGDHHQHSNTAPTV